MIYALLTALCWSISGFASSRLSRNFGAGPANLYRLGIASFILAVICLLTTGSLWLSGAPRFMLAGFFHLTVGDMALFAAFRRLGPRLSVLLVGSLAPPTALIAEWLISGTTLQSSQLLCAAGILLLVAVAVAPKEREHLSRRELQVGLALGTVAAIGQGLGTTIQRVGNVMIEETIYQPWTITFLRVSAGTAGVVLWMGFRKLRGENVFERPTELIPHQKIKGHPLLWLGISSIMGPIVGIMFLVTALENNPAALVQACIATMPVFMIPWAWILDGNKPSTRSVLSGCAAVGLTAWLMFL